MRNADETRRRILAAATAEFAAHGIAGARVDRIATAAASNKAQLYAYFGNKETLFDVVFTHHVEGNIDTVPLTVDDLAGYAVRLYDGYLADSALIRLATWARLERTPTGDLLPTDGVYADNLDKIIAGQRDGILSDEIEAVDLFSMVIALAMTWAQSSITRTASDVDPDHDHARRRRALAAAVVGAFVGDRSRAVHTLTSPSTTGV